jgi:hypothetical protein
MLTTSSPLAARMLFKLMLGSVKGDLAPILWSGARCVYRGKKKNVAVGSLADMTPLNWHVCFTPIADKGGYDCNVRFVP